MDESNTGTACSIEQALPRIDVIIPAQNEEDSISLVIDDLPKVGHVIVVDNDSSDQTATIAQQHGALVVSEPRRGYGSACLRGMQSIEERIARGGSAPSIVVFLDGDYSDHPDQLPDLIAPILEDRAEMVLGSRLLGQREPGAMPPQAVYGNRLACFLIRLFWRQKFTDLGPFRAVDYPSLKKLEMQDPNFGWTVEMQVKAIRHGLRILEIPVPYRRRVGVSKISGTVSGTIKAGYKILYTIARYAIKR